MKRICLAVSCLLSFCLLFGFCLFPFSASAKETLESYQPPDVISAEEQASRRYVERYREEEPNLYSLVFQGEEGTHVMRVFLLNQHPSLKEPQINSMICHEMGHALKLMHPSDSFTGGQRLVFNGCRLDYPNNNSTVYSVMNNGSLWGTNLLSASPAAHDRINLISKWQLHFPE